MSGVKVAVDPGPQNPLPGTEEASGRTTSNWSSKAMSVASEVGLVLLIVNSRSTEAPAPTGSPMKDLLRIGAGVTNSNSVAGLPVTGRPSISAEISLVVFMKLPGAASEGTWS